MMTKIENVHDPIIGQLYSVKCVLVIKRGNTWFPVIGTKHNDHHLGLNVDHYHIDWRFVPQQIINDQENAFRTYYNEMKKQRNIYFFAPVIVSDIVDEQYREMIYLRHFGQFPQDDSFSRLKSEYKDKRMKLTKSIKCPHQGTPLYNLIDNEGVVECPAHGLRWCKHTGINRNYE